MPSRYPRRPGLWACLLLSHPPAYSNSWSLWPLPPPFCAGHAVAMLHRLRSCVSRSELKQRQRVNMKHPQDHPPPSLSRLPQCHRISPRSRHFYTSLGFYTPYTGGRAGGRTGLQWLLQLPRPQLGHVYLSACMCACVCMYVCVCDCACRVFCTADLPTAVPLPVSTLSLLFFFFPPSPPPRDKVTQNDSS